MHANKRTRWTMAARIVVSRPGWGCTPVVTAYPGRRDDGVCAVIGSAPGWFVGPRWGSCCANQRRQLHDTDEVFLISIKQGTAIVTVATPADVATE